MGADRSRRHPFRCGDIANTCLRLVCANVPHESSRTTTLSGAVALNKSAAGSVVKTTVAYLLPVAQRRHPGRERSGRPRRRREEVALGERLGLQPVDRLVVVDGPVSYTHLTLPTNREV